MPGLTLVTFNSMATGATGKPMWPSDYTGLTLWLQGDQIQGIASGASLSAWTDSSASGAHATQASAVSQPIYVANARNGLGAVAFGTSVSNLLTSASSNFDSTTFALALSPTTSQPSSPRIVGADVTSNVRWSITNPTLLWDFVRSGSVVSGSLATLGQWHTLIGFADVSAQSICTVTVSGRTFVSSLVTSGTTGLVTAIGANLPSQSTYSGLLGEVISYTRNLNESERSSLDSYLRTKWAV